MRLSHCPHAYISSASVPASSPAAAPASDIGQHALPADLRPVRFVSRPLTIVSVSPALTVVSVWVRMVPFSLPLPAITLAETLMPLAVGTDSRAGREIKL
ncbi:hypothetical protein L8T01_19360 [Enterobacter roggenkampii]|nr:hypothetical protein [Enterobacter roggenkampii]MCK6938346.1 hypothetical protein [Enterobacter roggenkampii]